MFPTNHQQLIEFKTLEEIKNFKSLEAVTLTIGSFDAIHLGHQKLMQETVRIAKKNNTIPALLTFRIHPRKILNSEKSGAAIFSYEHRMELIFKSGIQKIFVINFSEEIAQLSPSDFIQKILLDSFHSKAIVTGEDFCFGKNRKGNVSFLKEFLIAKNILVSIIKPLFNGDLPVSTTRIRSLLLEKNIKGVNNLLGREYSLKGIVLHGFGRGHTLGFPTANIIPETEIMPTTGVYISNTIHKSQLKPSITNVGNNPTFSNQENEVALSVETHIINESLPLYGEMLEIIFLKFIRPEKKFENVEALKLQITEDIKTAKLFHGII
jgi:riboflavin kinase/FMN adenylyltransferase